MSNRVAVIGVGMTKFMRRAQEAPGELAAQAVRMALEDAGLDIDDIDAVTLGTAPDAFDGVHMKGEHLIAGAGHWVQQSAPDEFNEWLLGILGRI